jgi:hypothetical protein
MSGVRPWAALLVALLGTTVLLAGCSILTPGFDPTGACTSDGQAAGAYPDLEALIPTTLDGKPPQSLDSGRKCTPDGLGTLASHGLTEVRFAGAVWPTAAESGTSLAVFSAPDLTAAWLGEYYEAGAKTDSKVVSLKTSTPTVQGRPGFRLDAQNDTSLEAIVTWPDATGSVIRVAVVSEAARDGATPAKVDAAVQQAIAAFRP